MTEQQQEMLAQAFAQVLKSRNLTVHSASHELKIDRQALARMQRGNPASIETVERFASRLGLDMNDWRELNGYPRIEDTACQNALSGAEILINGLFELQERFGRPAPRPDPRGGIRTLTPEKAEEILRAAEELMLRRKD